MRYPLRELICTNDGAGAVAGIELEESGDRWRAGDKVKVCRVCICGVVIRKGWN